MKQRFQLTSLVFVILHLWYYCNNVLAYVVLLSKITVLRQLAGLPEALLQGFFYVALSPCMGVLSVLDEDCPWSLSRKQAHYRMTLKGHLEGAVNLQMNLYVTFQGGTQSILVIG